MCVSLASCGLFCWAQQHKSNARTRPDIEWGGFYFIFPGLRYHRLAITPPTISNVSWNSNSNYIHTLCQQLCSQNSPSTRDSLFLVRFPSMSLSRHIFNMFRKYSCNKWSFAISARFVFLVSLQWDFSCINCYDCGNGAPFSMCQPKSNENCILVA